LVKILHDNPWRTTWTSTKLRPRRASLGLSYLSWRDLFARGVVSSKTSARRLWGRDLFPRPVHLSERVIAWRESEVEAWAASRVHAPQPARGCAAVSQARKAKQDAKTK